MRAANSYSWHDGLAHAAVQRPHRVPAARRHVLRVRTARPRAAKFLDLLTRRYLAELGINAIEPLPIVEFSTPRSLGYNGTDLFSPEMDYQVYAEEIDGYLPHVNRLLAEGQGARLEGRCSRSDQPAQGVDRPLHAYGIAVIFDVVYNHAAADLRTPSRTRPSTSSTGSTAATTNRSLYFTDQDHTGPVFAFWKEEVRQFLIDNATFFVDEYHVDGFRYDQVTVIVQQNGRRLALLPGPDSDGASTRRSAINIAEYWGPSRRWSTGSRAAPASTPTGTTACGARFAVSSRRRRADATPRELEPVVDQLRAPGFRDAWRAVQYIESHDEVYRDRAPRIPALADGGNAAAGSPAAGRASRSACS